MSDLKDWAEEEAINLKYMIVSDGRRYGRSISVEQLATALRNCNVDPAQKDSPHA